MKKRTAPVFTEEAPTVTKATGRPSSFTQAKADIICEAISTSTKSLRTICTAEDLPNVSTVLRWLRDVDGFRAQYARAKQEQADFIVEQILEIADDTSNDTITVKKGDVEVEIENKEWVNRSKLRVESRKWLAGKLKPKVYGEKTEVEMSGEAKLTITFKDAE